MKITYYKPKDRTNPNGIEIDSEWPELSKKIQTELLLSKGYRRIEDAGTRIEPTPFEVPDFKLIEPRDPSLPYVRKWTKKSVTFKLSMEKMMDYFNKAGVLDRIMRVVRADSFVLDWWLNDRTYTRGNDKSIRVSKCLGIPVSQFEKMCLKCFETRPRA